MYEAAIRQVSVDPIISRLRPRTVGEILDQAFRLYRKYFLTFIAIIAVVVVPLQLAQQILVVLLVGGINTESLTNYSSFSSSTSSSELNQFFAYAGVIYGAIIVLGLVTALLQSLSQGALTAEIANSHLDKPVSFRDGYRQMLSRVGPLLGVIFLQIGIGIAVFIPIIILFALAFGIGISSGLNSSSGAGSGTAFLGLFCFSCLLIIPAFLLFAYVFVRFYVVTPVIMVEGLGPVQALRRSWELIRNYWWRTLGLLVVLYLLGLVVQLIPTYLVDALAGIFAHLDLVTQQVISGVVTVFTTLIFIPIQLTAVTLYYFDLRVRKEGFDLETALSQRYAMAPAWAGAGYGQPASATPLMPPPSLGQGQGQGYGSGYGYGTYDQYGQQYGQGMPTQPVGEAPRASTDTGPLRDEDAPALSDA